MSDDKCFTQKFMEGFGLEFPKDADNFVEIFSRFADEGGTFGQLIEELVEAFPEKKDRILGVPLFTEIDGEVYRATLPLEDYDQVE
jgi:hypothetical protein